MTKEYLTIDEAAEARSVSPTTIRRWIQNNRLAAYVGEYHTAVDRSELMAVDTSKNQCFYCKKTREVKLCRECKHFACGYRDCPGSPCPNC